MVCVNPKKKHCRGGKTEVRRNVESFLQPTSHFDANTRQYAHTVEEAVAGKYTGSAGEVIELGTGLKPLQYKDNMKKIRDFVTHPKDIPNKVVKGLRNIATKNRFVQTGRDLGNVFKHPGNAKNWGRLAQNIPMVKLGVATGKFFGGLFGKKKNSRAARKWRKIHQEMEQRKKSGKKMTKDEYIKLVNKKLFGR